MLCPHPFNIDDLRYTNTWKWLIPPLPQKIKDKRFQIKEKKMIMEAGVYPTNKKAQ